MRALVLSGGGRKGAYQVGALKYLLGDMGIRYDILSGISVGSLNCGFLSMFPCGKEKEALEELLSIWTGIKGTKDIHVPWYRGALWVLPVLWKSSLRNSAPLERLVRSRLDVAASRSSGKELRVGAVSLTTGKYRVFDQNYTDLPSAILASSSFPCILCPVRMGEELWTDGGVRDITPIQAAIDAGATSIDVVVTSPLDGVGMGFDKTPNTLELGIRVLDIMSDEILIEDFTKTKLINELVLSGSAPDKKYIPLKLLAPRRILTTDPMSFDPKVTLDLIDEGYRDASTLF